MKRYSNKNATNVQQQLYLIQNPVLCSHVTPSHLVMWQQCVLHICFVNWVAYAILIHSSSFVIQRWQTFSVSHWNCKCLPWNTVLTENKVTNVWKRFRLVWLQSGKFHLKLYILTNINKKNNSNVCGSMYVWDFILKFAGWCQVKTMRACLLDL